MKRPYGAVFARAYAAAWAPAADVAAPGVIELLQDAGVKTGHVVDLACGVGTIARRLVKSGYAVTGVDASPAMLALARRIAPRAKFLEGTFEKPRIPACDAVICTFDSLNYARSSGVLRRVFRAVFRGLRPGGAFVFDLITPQDLLASPLVRTTAKSGADWAVIAVVSRFHARRQKRYEITAFGKVGAGWRREVEVHEQVVFEISDVSGWLTDEGFLVRTSDAYPGRGVEAGRAVFIARKG